MNEIPFVYERIAPTTWAYLSSLLMLALFFKFNRFWSVRNFDLLLIILLAPGLLLIEGGRQWMEMHQFLNKPALSQEVFQPNADQEGLQDGSFESKLSSPASHFVDSDDLNLPGLVSQRIGYYWLFGVGALFLIRLLLDPSLVRKPLLDPNLTIGGLVFLGVSLMVFLFANIVTSEPTDDDLRGARDAVKLLQRQSAEEVDQLQLQRRGPGYRLFNLLPIIPSFNSGGEIMATDADQDTNMNRYVIAAKSLAIASQVLIVLGLMLFGYFNYGNFGVGVGTGVIYLMLPYTAIFTGHVLHTLPAALIVWALVCFRKPLLSGVLLGLAVGVSYYAIFLMPLWASFYWQRGVGRFLFGVLVSLTICIVGLIFTSASPQEFGEQLRTMFGFWSPIMEGLEGIWALGWDQWYRLPILVAFVVLCISFIFWPVEKNLGTLVSYSAAVMVAIQFWHGFGGGLYMAWYLPLTLLVFFRPNLSGRIALAELSERNWRPRSETAEDLIPAA